MGFNIISAAEAASYIKHGYNIGLSGFTPAGTPKAVTPEVAKIAEEEHQGHIQDVVSNAVRREEIGCLLYIMVGRKLTNSSREQQKR